MRAWCPKHRFAILRPIPSSLVSVVSLMPLWCGWAFVWCLPVDVLRNSCKCKTIYWQGGPRDYMLRVQGRISTRTQSATQKGFPRNSSPGEWHTPMGIKHWSELSHRINMCSISEVRSQFFKLHPVSWPLSYLSLQNQHHLSDLNMCVKEEVS